MGWHWVKRGTDENVSVELDWLRHDDRLYFVPKGLLYCFVNRVEFKEKVKQGGVYSIEE